MDEGNKRIRKRREDKMKRVYRVNTIWDAEAEVFYSVSDIEGFHIEASNRIEFEAIMKDVAPELIVSNHRTASENSVCSPKGLIPVILWQHQEIKKAAG